MPALFYPELQIAYEGKTFREIADIEGTKEQPINRSIQKAKKNLRDYLKQIS